MKTIFFFSILFYAIALPALGELMSQDLDKIRLIVKEEIKAEITELKREIKEDIANSEKNMREYINLRVDSVNTKVGSKVDGVNIKVDSVEEKITFLSYLVYALIALIVGAIAIPQLIMAWRSGRDRSLEKQVERLTQEMETLKQQIVKP
ncbi:MAG: hypothetical protein OYL97_05965 [Candidatus Poribacteria bacterium]|nr:hypothetical protein [Candidatus Poribacteria bacterium]